MDKVGMQIEWLENRDYMGHLTESETACPYCNGPSVIDDKYGPQPCMDCLSGA